MREKNQRDWSGECFWRNDSTDAQAADICSGDDAADIVTARSPDFVCASVAYVCDIID